MNNFVPMKDCPGAPVFNFQGAMGKLALFFFIKWSLAKSRVGHLVVNGKYWGQGSILFSSEIK